MIAIILLSLLGVAYVGGAGITHEQLKRELPNHDAAAFLLSLPWTVTLPFLLGHRASRRRLLRQKEQKQLEARLDEEREDVKLLQRPLDLGEFRRLRSGGMQVSCDACSQEGVGYRSEDEVINWMVDHRNGSGHVFFHVNGVEVFL